MGQAPEARARLRVQEGSQSHGRRAPTCVLWNMRVALWHICLVNGTVCSVFFVGGYQKTFQISNCSNVMLSGFMPRQILLVLSLSFSVPPHSYIDGLAHSNHSMGRSQSGANWIQHGTLIGHKTPTTAQLRVEKLHSTPNEVFHGELTCGNFKRCHIFQTPFNSDIEFLA